jgi:mono/diheme cytochrome c family protein
LIQVNDKTAYSGKHYRARNKNSNHDGEADVHFVHSNGQLIIRRRWKMPRLIPSWLKAFSARSWVLAGALVAATAFVAPSLGVADDPEEKGKFHAHDVTDVWDIARGGQLYDNWMSVIEAEKPEASHPAYPKEGKQKGAATWRCKECHGWDYSGKDGAYAKGSHHTGIKGVREVAGVDSEKIHKIIMDKTHGFTVATMPHSAMEKLALFLSKGQINMDQYIDRKSKVARGDIKRGATFYQTICANCHGFDGKEINFKDPPKVEYVGTVCHENPWEALHKIRFGQPGVPMVAMIALSVQDQVDILAYCQTLPPK